MPFGAVHQRASICSHVVFGHSQIIETDSSVIIWLGWTDCQKDCILNLRFSAFPCIGSEAQLKTQNSGVAT